MLLDKALVNRNCTGMTLQLDNITVIPFLLTHLSQFGSNGSHVKAKPFGCYAALTAPPFPLEKTPPPGRKTPGFGAGKKREVALPLVVEYLWTLDNDQLCNTPDVAQWCFYDTHMQENF